MPHSHNEHRNYQESVYKTNPEYLKLNHPSLSPRMVSLVLHWVQQCCEVFYLKRETYYLASCYFHLYLSKVENLKPKHLQLIATSCLLIAFKIEELGLLSCNSLVEVNNGQCSKTDIVVMEKHISKTLCWKLYPKTLNNILGQATRQWDDFVNGNLRVFISLGLIPQAMDSDENKFNNFIGSKVLCDVSSIVENNFCFQDSQYAERVLGSHPTYSCFRYLAGILDMIDLDIKSLEYNKAKLVLSVLYLVIGLRMSIFHKKHLKLKFKHAAKTSDLGFESCSNPDSSLEGTTPISLFQLLQTSDPKLPSHYQSLFFKIKNFTYLFTCFLRQEYSCTYASLVDCLEYASLFVAEAQEVYQMPEVVFATEQEVRVREIKPLRFSDIINSFTFDQDLTSKLKKISEKRKISITPNSSYT
ncbi:unnamed protein product [Moneuplotes crassus]|uniref:Cyclin-like domain-containing protein n=1 Tax=Euplotes crassus TaxID=5936 RepID=A0AAD1X322_EUPCR|nr:unnamed protein product [Moneuplotes crassus]